MAVLLTPVVAPVPVPAQQPEVPALQAALPLGLAPIRRRTVTLNQDHLLMADPEGTGLKRVGVVLEELAYRGTMLRLREGKVKRWSGLLVCYELRATDSDIPYTWAFWRLGIWASGFRLFSTENAGSYLAWVEHPVVFLAEVSRPRDRCLALAQDWSRQGYPPEVEGVTVGELASEAYRWPPRDYESGINVRSVAKDAEGNWVLRVSPLDSDQGLTLVGKDGKWRRQ